MSLQRLIAERSSRGRGKAHFQRDSREKTGRRLTSDPIRSSLGLLPSGPDPVGEWLVHRQSPGPYLGPKGPESKRAWMGTCAGATLVSSWPGLDPAIHVLLFRSGKKAWIPRGQPGHDGVLFAGLLSARLFRIENSHAL